MEAFTIAYTVLGGLGIFFYGMKTMSDALQTVAGDMIKTIINSLTANRVCTICRDACYNDYSKLLSNNCYGHWFC